MGTHGLPLLLLNFQNSKLCSLNGQNTLSFSLKKMMQQISRDQHQQINSFKHWKPPSDLELLWFVGDGGMVAGWGFLNDVRYETINVPTQYVFLEDKIASEAMLGGFKVSSFNPDKHDFKTWSFPKVGIRKQIVETTTENGKSVWSCQIMLLENSKRIWVWFLSALISYKQKQLPIPKLHTCTYSSGRHSSGIRLYHFWTLTSISCFVPLLHCRLDLKAISAFMIHADL